MLLKESPHFFSNLFLPNQAFQRVLLLLLASCLLSACSSGRETRLQTVEQVEARRAEVAQKTATKQAKIQAKAEAKVQAKAQAAQAAKAKQMRIAQAKQSKAKKQPMQAGQSQGQKKTAKSMTKPAPEKGRFRSMFDKVVAFGKKPFNRNKDQRSTKSDHKVAENQSAENAVDVNSPSMAQPQSESMSVASASQTISHPDNNKVNLLGQTIELVGVLSVVRSEDCALAAGCGPEYSLLAPDMRTRVYALTGNIRDDLSGQLIAVKGLVSALPTELAASSGYHGIAEVLEVAQYVAISDYAYYPFISQAASEYSQSEYGCKLLWDKTYSWYLDGKQPRFTVKMTNSRALTEPKPYLELAFDGNDRNLLSISLVPHSINPCET